MHSLLDVLAHAETAIAPAERRAKKNLSDMSASWEELEHAACHGSSEPTPGFSGQARRR